MFVVFLKFSRRKELAPQHMAAHKTWLERGFEDGVFLLAGSLSPSEGGGILAHQVSRAELEARLNNDPFVVEDVVQAEIIEMTASRADPRLGFLLQPLSAQA
jgi:uncharacterized protein YciI